MPSPRRRRRPRRPTTTHDDHRVDDGFTAAAAGERQVTTLEKYTVSDVPITEQILPTVRPIGDVYGRRPQHHRHPALGLERQRGVDGGPHGQERHGLRPVLARRLFGGPVRHPGRAVHPRRPGQIYVDGQLSLFSRNSTPPSFNGVEAMDIVKGPGSAVYGPQGEGAGGYVDFVMKQPYFDATTGRSTPPWATGRAATRTRTRGDDRFRRARSAATLAYRVSYLER